MVNYSILAASVIAMNVAGGLAAPLEARVVKPHNPAKPNVHIGIPKPKPTHGRPHSSNTDKIGVAIDAAGVAVNAAGLIKGAVQGSQPAPPAPAAPARRELDFEDLEARGGLGGLVGGIVKAGAKTIGKEAAKEAGSGAVQHEKKKHHWFIREDSEMLEARGGLGGLVGGLVKVGAKTLGKEAAKEAGSGAVQHENKKHHWFIREDSEVLEARGGLGGLVGGLVKAGAKTLGKEAAKEAGSGAVQHEKKKHHWFIREDFDELEARDVEELEARDILEELD